MNTTGPPGSLEDVLAESLDMIDRMLAQEGMPLHMRPMSAAMRFVEFCVVKVNQGNGCDAPPGKLTDYAGSKWFQIIFRGTENWYRDRFGDAMEAGRSDGRNAATLIRDTPYLVKVPMTTTEPGTPGESFWLCYHDAVRPGEDVLRWIRHGPVLDNLATKDVKAARTITEEISTKLRATHIALLGLDGTDPRLVELRNGILPNIERAAWHLSKADAENVRLAHWDMQMACELALKCLAQQRSGSFKETHDLFVLYDGMPESVPPFARTELSKLPNWERMVELRYGGGPPITVRQAFRSYRATVGIVTATTGALKKSLQLGNAKFHLKRPPWMEEV